MAPSAKEHHRSKSLLLFQKLLNQRDSSSPLTLIFDSLEQPATPVIKEFATRAKISQSKVIFVSFLAFRKPAYADVFIPAWGRKLSALRTQITSHYPRLNRAALKATTHPRALLIIDSLNTLLTTDAPTATPFLSSLITPTTSLLAIHHSDVPTLLPPSHSEYTPHPLTLLTHLATAILHLTPLSHEIACATARYRALPEPPLGLPAQPPGALISLNLPSSASTRTGVVIRMNLRRKSGRQVSERFLLRSRRAAEGGKGSMLGLLAEQPGFRPPEEQEGEKKKEEAAEELTTFSLGLTEKQRRDREEIVLPYFDAQTEVGGGEGGRILYEMGSEDFDDFDEEEDEEI